MRTATDVALIFSFLTTTLREKCPYSDFFWSLLPRIWTEYGEILRVSPYSVRMRENIDRKNSEYGHFSHSVKRSFSTVFELKALQHSSSLCCEFKIFGSSFCLFTHILSEKFLSREISNLFIKK